MRPRDCLARNILLALVLSTALVVYSRAADDAPPSWALDSLGPEIALPDGRRAIAAVRYWNDVVGVAFTRDARVEIAPTQLDLDLDGRPDVEFSGVWELPGGLLANPQMAGFVPTPDDPAGTPGEQTISTGFLGVREERDPQTGRGTGRYGFNCWVCHGAADAAGRIVLGAPNTNIHLGIIMASSAALDPQHVIRAAPGGPPITAEQLRERERLDASFDFDSNRDGRVTIAEWRAALSLPLAVQTQAALMLAGPGRLDQSVDHRMDGTIPLANLQHHDRAAWGAAAYLRRAKSPKLSCFNPVSIPQNVSGLGVAHYSWSGKDSAMRVDAVEVLMRGLSATAEELALRIDYRPIGALDREALQRAITLDLRNVATAGRETDTLEGIGWPGRLLSAPTPTLLDEVPPRYDTARLRDLLISAGAAHAASASQAADDAEVARGRRIFFEREVGTILNQRVVIGREARVPPEYRGIAVIAPLDRSQPLSARVPVRCGSCHNYSPLANLQPILSPLAAAQRCDLCHFDHPSSDQPGRFVSLAAHMQAESISELSGCLHCHGEHPAFGPQVYSNSWLLPFDGDGDGETRHDSADDAAAGAIGVDAMLNIDTNFSEQLKPPARRPRKMFMLATNAREAPDAPRFSRAGTGWVRVAPLLRLGLSAPYLHNGSVPTLAALLESPERRPTQFAVGLPAQRFTYDTRLPGNTNSGHVFGVDLGADEKRALLRFLESLP